MIEQDVGYRDYEYTGKIRRESYIVYGGLDVENDHVIGDYEMFVALQYAWVETAWTLTARIGDEVLWVKQGTFQASTYPYRYNVSYDTAVSDTYTAAVNEYTAGDCEADSA